MATSPPMFSKLTTPSPDPFQDQLKAASNTAYLLDLAQKNKITCLAVRVWRPRFHHLNFLQYQSSYAFTTRLEDPNGERAWDMGRFGNYIAPGSQPGTIVLHTEDYLIGIFTFIDGEWKMETPA